MGSSKNCPWGLPLLATLDPCSNFCQYVTIVTVLEFHFRGIRIQNNLSGMMTFKIKKKITQGSQPGGRRGSTPVIVSVRSECYGPILSPSFVTAKVDGLSCNGEPSSCCHLRAWCSAQSITIRRNNRPWSNRNTYDRLTFISLVFVACLTLNTNHLSIDPITVFPSQQPRVRGPYITGQRVSVSFPVVWEEALCCRVLEVRGSSGWVEGHSLRPKAYCFRMTDSAIRRLLDNFMKIKLACFQT